MRIVARYQRDAVKRRWPWCAYCRQPFGKGGRDFTVDHVVPLCRGGSKRTSNLVGCCRACNVAKGNRTPEEWLAELADAVQEVQRMQASETAGVA